MHGRPFEAVPLPVEEAEGIPFRFLLEECPLLNDLMEKSRKAWAKEGVNAHEQAARIGKVMRFFGEYYDAYQTNDSTSDSVRRLGEAYAQLATRFRNFGLGPDQEEDILKEVQDAAERKRRALEEEKGNA